ncbi:MAG: HAMP domain-containing protein [Phycisphaerales bacterium]|nr:HAMP domain-containing protein [Phycisphaerales bacterium]
MPILRLSLRMKLTLWFLVIFVVVFCGLLVAAGVLHREATRRVLDSQLTMLARGVAEMLQASDREALADGLSRFQPIDRASVVLAVRSDDGRVLGAGWRVDPSALPELDERQSIGQVVIHKLDGQRARGLLGREVTTRMVTYRFMMPDGAPAFLDLAGATDLREEELSYFRGVFLVGGLGAVLAAGLAAWLIAGRAVQPMKQLARAAEQVDSEHFGTRIEVERDEVEVAGLKAALNDALNRLEEGYRAQERFVSNVAHDLKTPIAVMLTESQVLRPGLVSSGRVRELPQQRDHGDANARGPRRELPRPGPGRSGRDPGPHDRRFRV